MNCFSELMNTSADPDFASTVQCNLCFQIVRSGIWSICKGIGRPEPTFEFGCGFYFCVIGTLKYIIGK